MSLKSLKSKTRCLVAILIVLQILFMPVAIIAETGDGDGGTVGDSGGSFEGGSGDVGTVGDSGGSFEGGTGDGGAVGDSGGTGDVGDVGTVEVDASEASDSEVGNSYVASITPNGVVGTNKSTMFKATFTEEGGDQIGSASIELPSGFIIAPGPLDPSAFSFETSDNRTPSWEGNVVDLFIYLKAANAAADNFIESGESVSVTFNATTPNDVDTHNLKTLAYTDIDWLVTNNPAGGFNETLPVTVSSTIQGAIDSPDIVDGDNIHVHPGTYNEALTIPKSISLIGSGMDSTIIQPTAPNNAIEITNNNVEFILRDIQLKVNGTSRLINFTGRENTTVIIENTKMDYSQEGRGIQAHNSLNTEISIINSIMNASDAAGKLGSGYGILLIGCPGASLNITDSKIVAAHYGIYLASSGAEININESEVTGYASIAIHSSGSGSVIYVDDSVLTGRTFWSGYFYNPPVEDANSFATVAFQTSNCTMYVTNSTITNEWVGDNTSYQMLIHIGCDRQEKSDPRARKILIHQRQEKSDPL